MISRLAKSAAGLVAGAFFLYLSFRSVSLVTVGASLAAGERLIPAMAILVGVCVFTLAKAMRWRILLGDPAAITGRALLGPVSVGLLFNSLIPHSGELARAAMLSRTFGRPASAVLVSIAIERLFDFLIVLAFAISVGLIVPLPDSLAPAVRILSVAAGILGVGIAVALMRPALFTTVAGACARRLPATAGTWLVRQVGHALEGVEPLRRANRMHATVFWSAVQWGSVAWCVHFCGRAAGVSPDAIASLCVVIAMVVVFTLPNAPAYVGSTQAAFLAALVPLGYPGPAALAASLVYTVGVVGLMMVFGVLALMLEKRAVASAP